MIGRPGAKAVDLAAVASGHDVQPAVGGGRVGVAGLVRSARRGGGPEEHAAHGRRDGEAQRSHHRYVANHNKGGRRSTGLGIRAA